MLQVSFDDESYDLDIPPALIHDAEELYRKMDADMDQGWQLSRQWVEKPDAFERCQIVANKILTAFHEQNEEMILLFGGYILSRLPEAKHVIIDTAGDITQTDIQG